MSCRARQRGGLRTVLCIVRNFQSAGKNPWRSRRERDIDHPALHRALARGFDGRTSASRGALHHRTLLDYMPPNLRPDSQS